MTSVGDADDDRRRVSRLTLLIVIVSAHLLAIWLLLQSPLAGVPSSTSSILTSFDVVTPMSVPPEEPPPPAPTRGGSGSPGINRQKAAIMAEAPAPPMREAIDAVLSPTMASAPAIMAGTAALDLGAGGAGGDGVGSGLGVGNGSGRGVGDGAGSEDADEDRYARADWIKRPSQDAYERHWPIGRSLPNYPVTITLTCYVRRNLKPGRCRKLSEAPANAGFGTMVLRAIEDSRVRPVARNGNPVWDKAVLITIVLDRLETAPRLTSTASVPPAR